MVNTHGGRPDAEDLCEFQVVGELKDDPGHLLLMCASGRWYSYDIAGDEIEPVEPTDSWAVDVIDRERSHVGALLQKAAS